MGISLRKPENYFSDTLQVRCPPVLPPRNDQGAILAVIYAHLDRTLGC